MTIRIIVCFSLVLMSVSAWSAEPGYVRDVQPVLRKYCGGCHNEADREADFSVATYEALLKGTPEGRVIAANDPDQSRLLHLISGQVEPKMPPSDQAQPTAEEVAILRAWIAAGAKNDARQVPLAEQIMPPSLPADPRAAESISAMTDAGQKLIAIGRAGKCQLVDSQSQQVVMEISDLAGKINQLRLSRDQQYLLIAGGIAGVGGQVVIVNLKDRSVAARIQGHTDAIYCACLSPDNQYLCTGSYDRVAILWNWQQQTEIRRFVGHNGAVYDVDIDPESRMLATASADQTVKLWGVQDGARLDTLGQPEGEMLCVRFSPDGRSVLASGADRQVRMWELISKDHPAINPLRISRFAHEEPVTQIVFRGPDQLLTLSEDKSVKLWSLPELAPLGVISQASDVPTGVALVSSPENELLISDFAGQLTKAPITTGSAATQRLESSVSRGNAGTSWAHSQLTLPAEASAELEPNNLVAEAQSIALPYRGAGVIAEAAEGEADVDCFAFETAAGLPWVIEVHAARDKSPLDSLIEVLQPDGQPVLRTRLQAVRESYFTFRGKDSFTIDDYRLHKWQEMELNEWLYAGGEVVKLWMYPRGPDSGFKVYPGYGSRVTLLDTTPITHALGEMAYIVRELDEGAAQLPNGLPVFPVHYQNDDDGTRRSGKDSRLTFTAREAGRYVIRLRDARGFGGAEFKYQLVVRPQQPDFEIEVRGADMTLPTGSGREWQVVAKRLDDLAAPIEIHVADVPSGLHVSNPLVIEEGQDIAYGNLYADSDFKLPAGQEKLTLKLKAISRLPGSQVEHELTTPLTVSIKDQSEVRLKLTEVDDTSRELTELTIRPGQTISARVVIDRQNDASAIGVGKEDAGRNLPHGSYVDNIGLNGLLITEGNQDREFFITAARWLPPQERTFHLRSDTKNNPTSRSVRLRVLPSN